MDFGLARWCRRADDELTATGTLLGRSITCRPSRSRATSAIGPATDVYSLGAILYELADRPPALRGAPESLLAKSSWIPTRPLRRSGPGSTAQLVRAMQGDGPMAR